MDIKLRFSFYISAFHSVSVLHSRGHGISGEASFSEGGYCLGRSVSAKCMRLRALLVNAEVTDETSI